MWLTQLDNGSLAYSFVEAMDFKAPWLFVRFLGGVFFVVGLLMMVFNLYKTVTSNSVPTTAMEGK